MMNLVDEEVRVLTIRKETNKNEKNVKSEIFNCEVELPKLGRTASPYPPQTPKEAWKAQIIRGEV